MMGFYAASGLVSVISASRSRDYCFVLLFTVLFSNSNLYVYIEDGNTLTQKSRTLCKLPFAIEVGFLQSTPQGYSCLAITNDVVHNTFHLLFIEAEDCI